MLDKELSEAVTEIENPERKINVIAAIVITSVLWACLWFAIKIIIGDKSEENKALKDKIAALESANRDKQHEADSLRTVQYYYVLDQLKQEKQVKQFFDYQDSLNAELKKVKNQLTSK